MALTFKYKSFITREDILKNGGYDINNLSLDDRATNEEVATGFLLLIAKMVYELISKYTNTMVADNIYTACETNTELLNIIERSQFYQAIYVIENCDLASFNGLNGNNIIALSELRGDRQFSQSAINELTSAGLLFIGVD